MDSLFPTWWELLLPNLNATTIWGIVLIILGIVIFVLAGRVDVILNRLNAPITVGRLSLILVFIGVVLTWGISIAQDFLSSLGGTLIFYGSVITLAFAFFLFGTNKKKSGGRLKL